MINHWERGRAQVDQLLQQSRLTRVAANRELAVGHLAQAATHLTAAATLRDLDPAGAFTLAYDEPPRQAEIREFDWMRRLRNDTQYPDIDRPSAGVDDVDQAIPAAKAIVERAMRLVDIMPSY